MRVQVTPNKQEKHFMEVRGKIFYGWWVVVALFVVGMVGPLGRFCMTGFFPFISSDLGWSRSTIGSAQSLSFWTYGIFVLIAGWMTDRYGSRKTILLGGAVYVIGFLFLSTVRSVWQLYLYYAVILAFAVSLTHLVPIQTTVRKWFRDQAGLAGGITASAYAVGLAIFGPLITEISTMIGWRCTSLFLGIILGAPILILSHFVIRDAPESVCSGFHRTGSLHERKQDASSRQSWSVRHAMKTPQLWLLLLAHGIGGISFAGLFGHLVMWGIDEGVSISRSGILMTVMLAPSVVARVGGGWLGDRYGKRAMISISNMACTLVMLWAWQCADNYQGLFLTAFGIGITYGLAHGLYAPYLGDLFGRSNLGVLFGILTMGFGFIGGAGPLVWGKIQEIRGSYNTACLFSSVCSAVATIAAVGVKPIRRKM